MDRCFGFVDLCGFTAFTERNGDERAVLVLAQLRAALREASARRGVRVVKWLGDGAMLSSTMIDAVAALVVELDVRMSTALPSLAVRGGMDWGPVIMFEGDDYIGRAVNVAARLCDHARPHELLATNAVASSPLPPWITVQPTSPAAIRGFDSKVDYCRISLTSCDGDGVVDPVCGLTVPRGASVGPPVVDGDESRFCSEACAGSWRR